MWETNWRECWWTVNEQAEKQLEEDEGQMMSWLKQEQERRQKQRTRRQRRRRWSTTHLHLIHSSRRHQHATKLRNAWQRQLQDCQTVESQSE